MSKLSEKINWEIDFRSVKDGVTGVTVPDYRLIRKINNDGSEGPVFNVAKTSYNPPTVAEFTRYYNELADITGFTPIGFQEWSGGKQIFGYLKNNKKDFDINGHQIEDYLMIGAGFNENVSFFVGTVNVLLCCSNQMGNINRTWKIRNTKTRAIKTEELFESFKQHMMVRDLMFESFRKFSTVQIDQRLINECKRTLMGLKEDETVDELGKIRLKNFVNMSSAITVEMNTHGENLWGLMNGITRHTTHDLKRKDDHRNIFGNVAIGETRHKINKMGYEFCKDYYETETGILLQQN